VFLRILNFVPIDGLTYEYATQVTLGGVAFRGINGTYNADTGVVNPSVEVLAIFGGLVKTDHQIASARGGVARTNAILAKTRKAGLFFDKYVIDGDPATIDKSFYGLKARLTGNQLIDAGANGAALTLDLLDQLLDRVAGPNSEKVFVMNKADRRKTKQLILAAAGGAAVADVGKGVTSYDGASIEQLDEDGDEAPIIAKTETMGSSNVTSSIYCVRPGKSQEGEWVQGIIKGKVIDHIPQGIQGTQVQDLDRDGRRARRVPRAGGGEASRRAVNGVTRHRLTDRRFEVRRLPNEQSSAAW
jgi:hypothetical protein